MANRRVWSIMLLIVVVGVVTFTPAVSGYLYWCSPKLWEGDSWTLHIRHTDQGIDILENTAQFSVDVIGQRYARHETGHHNGQPYSIFYLYYYPAGALYKVQDGHCETSQLQGNLSQHCVEMPDNHVEEYLKEYLGSYNSGVWSNGVRTLRTGLGHFYSVDPEGPIPLNEATYGDIDNVPTYTVTNYYNVTQGIKDPTIFTPPASCIQT